MRPRPTAAVGMALFSVVLALWQTNAAQASTIGVYFDAAGTICKGTIEPGVPGSIYVVIRFDDGDGGVAGTEFRFVGMPPSWSAHPVANSSILAIGDPFGGGVTAGFGQCVGVTQEPFVVYSILVLAQESETDLEFEARTRVPSTNPNFRCPIVTLCDEPYYTAVCVPSVRCRVNSERASFCAEVTAVTPSSWTAVKALYSGR